MFVYALLPLAVTAQSGEVRLDTLDLGGMTQEWASPRANRSVDGGPLKIGSRTFSHGIGTHAESEWTLPLRGNGVTYKAWVGVDTEGPRSGSVVFQVWGDSKKLFDSGVMRGGEEAKEVSVSLVGVRNLRLVVTNAGDGIDSDHADWADAVITLKDSKKSIDVRVHSAPPIKIAKPDLTKVQINGPRVVGCTPGHEFIFRVPATGTNLKFSAANLPKGLGLDASTGIITGSVAEGEYPVTINIAGDKGKDSRVITIKAKGVLALTPPMGWNSWNVWGLSVDADKVRASADSFVKTGLAAYGYQYVNIDDGWEARQRAADGEIVVNDKFKDMRPVADYVHSQGLKIGIYSSPGPYTCGGYLGSWQHEAQDADTYAKWGIDYLKYDWCSYNDISRGETLFELQKPYLTMSRALQSTNRDIVLSLCQYGMGDVYKWGGLTGGSLWRTTGDITDTWSSMSGIGFDHSRRSPYVKPGRWNDPDMLVVGHLGWGPSIRPTRLTPNEQITHITLWSMLAAPLLIGCDLTKIDDFTASLLMNHDVIEIDQDPLAKAAVQVIKDDPIEVWTRPLFDGTTAVALFNRGGSSKPFTVKLSDLGIKGSVKVRDLWQQKDLGKSTQIVRTIPAHAAFLFKVG